jgi:phage/plasmid-like protein (TIGR03299 family)
MAHELTQNTKTGRYEFAFSGSRSAVWHGLGQELTQDASIDTWKTEAGMDWEIFQSAVQYQSMDGQHTFADKNVLFRSDDKAPLSVVSSNYKIVQPSQVLEFFRDLTEIHGFKLSAAGTIFGGRRFWATADMGKTTEAVAGDKVNGQLLVVSSCDGSIATIAKICATRVVCSNTMALALSENSKNVVKKTHKSDWNPESVKLDLGLIDESWVNFSNNIKKLAEVEVTPAFAMNYFQKKFYNPSIEADKQTWGAVKKVNTLMGLFENGTGADFSRGTAWGVVNAVTEMGTHGTSAKQDPSRRFWESEFGANDKIKSEVYSDMLAMMA